MRMRIPDGWNTVRSPARMGDSRSRSQFAASLRLLFQIPDLADGFDRFQFLSAQGKPSRIITAVFQPLQSIQQYFHCRFISGISDYSAHKTSCSAKQQFCY